MNVNKLLIVVIVLQGLILLGQWTARPDLATPAMAQIPDSGALQSQMVDELRSLNTKMDKLIGILQDGNLQVQVKTPDEKKAPAQ